MLLEQLTCKMDPKERKDCGYYGIKGPECKGKGCCWSEKVEGVPWCFYNKVQPGNEMHDLPVSAQN